MTEPAPRVLFVSRRFWPLLGGAETVIANLAAALAADGSSVTVLTAKWDPSWPSEIMHRGVRVVRLAQPRLRIWGTLRYLQQLNRWLRDHRNAFDLVYVSQLKHDAWVAVRAGEVQLSSDFACGQRRSNGRLPLAGGGRPRRAVDSPRRRRAAADHRMSEAIRDELVAAGYSPERVIVIPNGVKPARQRSGEPRRAARRVIAEANPELEIQESHHLTVFTGRLIQ